MDPNLVRGTIPTLILSVLAEGPNYGYEISETIKARTQGRLKLSVAALYTTLKRLEDQSLIGPCEGVQSGARERRYYEILPAGQTFLKTKLAEWNDFTEMTAFVFSGTGPRS